MPSNDRGAGNGDVWSEGTDTTDDPRASDGDAAGGERAGRGDASSELFEDAGDAGSDGVATPSIGSGGGGSSGGSGSNASTASSSQRRSIMQRVLAAVTGRGQDRYKGVLVTGSEQRKSFSDAGWWVKLKLLIATYVFGSTALTSLGVVVGIAYGFIAVRGGATPSNDPSSVSEFFAGFAATLIDGPVTDTIAVVAAELPYILLLPGVVGMLLRRRWGLMYLVTGVVLSTLVNLGIMLTGIGPSVGGVGIGAVIILALLLRDRRCWWSEADEQMYRVGAREFLSNPVRAVRILFLRG